MLELHTSVKDPILSILISERSINTYILQIVVAVEEINELQGRMEKIFENIGLSVTLQKLDIEASFTMFL